MAIFSRYVIYFVIYAFIGWVIEVVAKYIETGKLINRGFLIGPICPIYGRAGVLFIFFIYNTNNIFLVFLKSVLICSILEYSASYIMEKLFNARWWDYSHRKFNLNGRICLGTLIPFGLLGVFFKYAMHPFFENIVNMLSDNVVIVLAIIFIILYILDNLIGYIVGFKIKKQIEDNRKDSTEFIKGSIYEWVYKRLKTAFPGFHPIRKVKTVLNRNKKDND